MEPKMDEQTVSGKLARNDTSDRDLRDLIVYVWERVMRSTERFSITLTPELAELVRSMVESGQYATDSEVIRDGLRLIQARNRAVDSWLKTEVVPAYEKLKADPSRAISGEEVDKRMAERRMTRRQKGT
jgi:antitoxin ParD1/3/4